MGNNRPLQPVIFLMGATATGKTELAIEISSRFPVELISVDSAQIYRDMDIGTAKPDANTLSHAPHFLIDIIDPENYYSAWDFVENSKQLITQISARGNVPLLVGGSMMYFYALENGLNNLPEANQEIRNRLNQEAKRIGWKAMHEKLELVDETTARRIEPGDTQRIQRALEVFEISGEPLSSFHRDQALKNELDITKIILEVVDRAALHSRIEARFSEMINNGFIQEVENLRQRAGLNLSLPSMRCVGYRQMWQHLEGELSYDEMIFKSVVATRQLAKRQMTWLRKQPQVNAFDCLNYSKSVIFKVLDKVFPGA